MRKLQSHYVKMENLKLKIKRIYEHPSQSDGYRIVVDRIWPRGIKKENAKLDEWNRDIAPSADLRKWFGHDAQKFQKFAQRYKNELKEKKEETEHIRNIAKNRQLCILYGAKDEIH